jgi:hypothetical protein
MPAKTVGLLNRIEELEAQKIINFLMVPFKLKIIIIKDHKIILARKTNLEEVSSEINGEKPSTAPHP